ncbi:hypothetical protein FRC11_012587 [Ceratobasidium sp. 423]|nr:hypothetical protein FRC11_012587 [Ceratobasidium sp. 423]
MSDLPGSTMTSRLVEDPSLFSQWVTQVQLDQAVREDSPPACLERLLEESKKTPKWATDLNAARYKYTSPSCKKFIEALRVAMLPEYPHFSDDEELCKDVSYAISMVFRVCKQAFDLTDNLPAPTKAD